METAKLKKRISARDTLLALPIGKPCIIKNRMIKLNVVRSAITKLKNQGYSFDSTEAGRVDDMVVTRLK